MAKKLKILQINKFHYPRGGAERYVFELARLLEARGHKVINFSMAHENNLPSEYEKYFVKKVNLEKFSLINIIKFFYNYEAAAKLKKLIKDEKPDIAHLHNIAHQLSPAIISVLRDHRVPMVQTLHDYKLICPNYRLYSRGKICGRCRGGRYYNCFFGKCLHESRARSFLGMLEAYWSHNILKIYDRVDLFIAPSRFMKDICVKFGAPADKIKVIYNFIGLPEDGSPPPAACGDYFLYFGRLSPEKGIEVLIKAWRRLGREYKLKIAGGGPSDKILAGLINDLKLGGRIEMIGPKYGEELRGIIRRARAVILPSLWPENMPYSALESLALGKAVIASRVGGLPEIIKDGKNGFLFKAGGADELAEIIRDFTPVNIEKNPEEFGESRHYQEIIRVYEDLIKS